MNNLNLTREELNKLVKANNLEVFTKSQFNQFISSNEEILLKGEKGDLDELEKSEYTEIFDEIRSFTPVDVYDKEEGNSFLTKSLVFTRVKQVEWDQIKEGDDLSKARGGTYTNTAENRKLGRVGAKYGAKKEPEGKGDVKAGDHVDFIWDSGIPGKDKVKGSGKITKVFNSDRYEVQAEGQKEGNVFNMKRSEIKPKTLDFKKELLGDKKEDGDSKLWEGLPKENKEGVLEDLGLPKTDVNKKYSDFPEETQKRMKGALNSYRSKKTEPKKEEKKKPKTMDYGTPQIAVFDDVRGWVGENYTNDQIYSVQEALDEADIEDTDFEVSGSTPEKFNENIRKQVSLLSSEVREGMWHKDLDRKGVKEIIEGLVHHHSN